ncbi:hypothetical protein IQ07DRAFT_160920 [Pyrenochaeta sp. DS3sAY3a]|nr:hypothetical protein IQ07DRAFT_160920 [Pyrenochaeta sp. DS3sAY3a]
MMATMESVRRDIKLLRQPSPGPGHRRYVRIYSKKARSMLSPSSSTSYSRKGNRPSRPNTPSKSPRQGFPELSDVPCYTCRRRHVKCDRILPHCAKCAKKGVACLGYKKPLRWADGVAVRGKLKGKAQPVVDSVAIDLTRKAVEETFPSIWEDAAHLGLHTTDNCCSNVVGSTSSFLELVDYCK